MVLLMDRILVTKLSVTNVCDRKYSSNYDHNFLKNIFKNW